jgi:hypothetical protein
MNARRIMGVLAIFTAVALFTTYLSEAQEARGAITGKVIDPGQAIVAGAAVKVTNVAMGTTVAAVTNDAGLYQATYLIPGTYRIEVEASGFKRYVRDKITLRVNDTPPSVKSRRARRRTTRAASR